MILSQRWQEPRELNSWTQAKQEMEAWGVPLLDLSDSNPTHFGLGTPDAPACLSWAASRSQVYEPSPRGLLVAREALAVHFGGSPDDYWLTSSTSEAYSWIFSLLTDPGYQVGVPVPGYPLIEPLARYSGLGTAPYPLYYVHPYGWSYDLDQVEELCQQPQTRMLVLVSPGNPTGAYIHPATFEAIAHLCRRYDVGLIVDEVFRPYELVDGTALELPWDDIPVVTFSLNGLSKLLCAPGLKLSWLRLRGPAEEVAQIRPILDEIADTFLPVSSVVAHALPALLRSLESTVAVTTGRLRTNLAQAEMALASLGRLRWCEGGWSAIVDLPPPPDGSDLATAILRYCQVVVHPGWFYDLADPSAIVFSLLGYSEDLVTACRRIAQVIGR